MGDDSDDGWDGDVETLTDMTYVMAGGSIGSLFGEAVGKLSGEGTHGAIGFMLGAVLGAILAYIPRVACRGYRKRKEKRKREDKIPKLKIVRLRRERFPGPDETPGHVIVPDRDALDQILEAIANNKK